MRATVYTHRESLVRNHEPRAKALGNYNIYIHLLAHYTRTDRAHFCALFYLDVLITLDNGRYSTAVFDKRDSFTFNIVNFPHLSSNMDFGTQDCVWHLESLQHHM